MLTGSLEVGAGLVNLCLGDGRYGQAVEGLLQVFDIVGQIGIGGYDDVVDQIGQHVAQCSLLLGRQTGLGNGSVGLGEFCDSAHAGIDGAIAITLVLVLGLGIGTATILVVVTVTAAGSETEAHQQSHAKHKNLFHLNNI